jgi:TorA maturation chaperone TorD
MAEAVQQAELSEEDRARANCYALVSRLFYAPPDAALLDTLLTAAIEGGAEPPKRAEPTQPNADVTPPGYAEAFLALQRAARSADIASLRQEYDDIFVSAGKALVTLYTSGYALPNAPDRHLVALREQLAAWGLARGDAVFEVEDHVSGICDAMRWLIEGGRSLEEQRAFFDEYVYTGVGLFCDTVLANASASFYRAAAALARAFLGIENEGFALHATE